MRTTFKWLLFWKDRTLLQDLHNESNSNIHIKEKKTHVQFRERSVENLQEIHRLILICFVDQI